MDWQLVLDIRMVVNYMTNYVTKNDMANNKSYHRVVKYIYCKSVESEGRSVQSFLRRAMSKLLGERMMSKQETCHLMMGLPMVYCITLNLCNTSYQVIVPDQTPNANQQYQRVLLNQLSSYPELMDMPFV